MERPTIKDIVQPVVTINPRAEVHEVALLEHFELVSDMDPATNDNPASAVEVNFFFPEKRKKLLRKEEARKKEEKERNVINPYPHKFEALTISIYKSLNTEKHLKDVRVSLAGRLMSVCSSSKKRIFYDLHGGGGKVQVIAAVENSDLDEAGFSNYHSSVKRFDIVGVIGYPGLHFHLLFFHCLRSFRF
ncbi:lysine--tRNA ligase [Tanacetum coccineum]